jgi:S-(hydroxymethyl)glutathione dehydrogenase/alcohol dehydrogenase
MKAAVLIDIGMPLSVEDVTPLDPGPHDVMLEVRAAGVCHTDLGAADGKRPYPPPMILGHEASGIVTWVGTEVTQVRVGDKVIASPDPMCGRCWFCVHGQPHLCEALFEWRPARALRHDGAELAAMSGLGAFAETMTVNESFVVPIQSELPFDELALIGCGVTTGLGAAINAGQVTPGSSVAVIGCGAVGLSAIQGARLAGAGAVIAVDVLPHKLKIARRMGATDTVDASAGDAVESVKEITGGRGTDVAIEAVGSVPTTQQALAMARRGGTVVMIGAPGVNASLQLNLSDFMSQQKLFMASAFGHSNIRRDFPRYASLAERGLLDLTGMVSAHIALDEINDALELLRRGERIRSVIVP